jgi:hypothetical protein
MKTLSVVFRLVGRRSRPGRLISLFLALALVLATTITPYTQPATGAAAAVCQLKPTGRKGWLCWCKYSGQWKPAPRFLCR